MKYPKSRRHSGHPPDPKRWPSPLPPITPPVLLVVPCVFLLRPIELTHSPKADVHKKGYDAFDVGHMPAVSFKTELQTTTLYPGHDFLHLFIAQYMCGSGFDIANKAIAAGEILRHRRLEYGITDKSDDREDVPIDKPQQRLQGSGVFVVLM